jgi:hypothetical protein
MTTYKWQLGAQAGGGYGNAIAAHPTTPGKATLMGDTWGFSDTVSGGEEWIPRQQACKGRGDVYGRSVAYSRKIPGLRYLGIGGLKVANPSSSGYFGTLGDGEWGPMMDRRVNFSSNLPTGNAGDQPRAVGNLIAVDYDPTSGDTAEYVYALTRQGLMRSVDGAVWEPLNLPTPANQAAWACLAVMPGHGLFAASFRSNDAGSQAWMIRGARKAGHLNITPLPAAPAAIEDATVIDGRVIIAAGDSLYEFDRKALTFTKLASFAGWRVSSIVGRDGVWYAGNALGSKQRDYVRVSLDAGKTFTTKSTRATTVWGGTTDWWLIGSYPDMAGPSFSVSQFALDATDNGFVYLAGRGGIWVTTNHGDLWHPAGYGASGGDVASVKAGNAGEAWSNDTDYDGTHTTTHYQTVQRQKPPPLPAHSLSRGGVTVVPASGGKAGDIRQGSASIADDYAKACLATATSVDVAQDGTVYISRSGGGVLVGTRATAATGPSPVIDQSLSYFGVTITAGGSTAGMSIEQRAEQLEGTGYAGKTLGFNGQFKNHPARGAVLGMAQQTNNDIPHGRHVMVHLNCDGLPSLVHAGDKTLNIAKYTNGTWNATIDAMADSLYGLGVDIIFRPGYEMGPRGAHQFTATGADYLTFVRYLRHRFAARKTLKAYRPTIYFDFAPEGHHYRASNFATKVAPFYADDAFEAR